MRAAGEEKTSNARAFSFGARLPTEVFVGAALVWAAYGITGGCFAQRTPPALSAMETALIAQAPLPYSVLVVPWDTVGRGGGQNPDAYARGTYEWLRQIGAFRSVRFGFPGSEPFDIVAVSAGAYCNTAIIPIGTGLTLGLFPTTWTETNCEKVVFRSGASWRSNGGRSVGGDSIVVESTSSGTAMMGWLAIPVGAMPGWSHRAAEGSSRGRARSRLAIMQQRDALAKLAGKAGS